MIIGTWPYLHNGQYGYEHMEGKTNSEYVLRKIRMGVALSYPTPAYMKFAFMISLKWAYGKK